MPDEVTLDMEVDSDDEATDNLLDELFQLSQLTEQMCQQHQEALFIMNRIKEQMDQKDKLYVTGENQTKRDLDTALEELHTNAMQHIDQTGTSNFSESLLTMLSTCTISTF
uniref:Uncharacterized protein n=1 Tax=viral metagenome TaxID=1070528 RepID=A0A6C0IKH9_9ZZZZ